jgi:hypothetical protein
MDPGSDIWDLEEIHPGCGSSSQNSSESATLDFSVADPGWFITDPIIFCYPGSGPDRLLSRIRILQIRKGNNKFTFFMQE